MNEAERFIEGMNWLGRQLAAPTLTEQRIARCEKARNTAHDPAIQVVWEEKARQLRDKRKKEAN